MKNEYDNEKFFKQYANMARSQNGFKRCRRMAPTKALVSATARKEGA